MWKKSAALAATLLLCLMQPAAAKTLRVVASFTVLADMVGQVGGDHVRVKSLVGPNGDPHVYEPSPADANALAHADLVVESGLGLEGWIDRLISASGYKGPVVVASTGVAPRTMVDGDDGPSKGRIITDPHAWNSAANAALYAANIERALIKADPADAADLKASGDRYIAQLKGLDAWARQELAAVPPDRRKVITSHDAFSYFGRAYGVTFLAPQGVSTDAQPSPAQVAALITQIRAEKVKAVFIENQTDPRLVEEIAKEGHAKLGGALYPEALSNPDGPAASYAAMFRYNVLTLKAGMLGK